MVEFKDYENTQGLEELEGWRYFPIRAANRIKSFWESNRVFSYLRRHRLKRTLIISYALLGTMVWTATTAYFSPTRVTYLESQLQATQSFGNGLGSITATSMTYSSSNGLVVMELTTSDATSAIKKGINTENLDWQVFLPSSVKNPEAVNLEVIPLTGDKVYLVMRNVPSDYTLMVIRATNKTPNSNSLKIDVQEYNDYLSSSSNDASVSKQSQRKDKEGNKNYVDFFVTPQNELLKNKYVKNLSREKFALNIFEEELKYQKGQRKELLASAKTLDDSVKEDTKTLEQLKRESEYLVGNELTDKQSDMEAIEKSMDSKEKDGAKARENAAYVQTIIEQIEKNIGISKDYNNFELRSALVEKDILKANKIIKYFEENPKTNPIQMTLSLLFSFYSNLMLAYYAPDKSEQGIANMLGLRTPWQARDYMAAMRKYSGVKTMQIVGEIRYADAKSKGVKNSSMSDGDILRELVFKILH